MQKTNMMKFLSR